MVMQPGMSWGLIIFLFLGAIALATVMALVIKLLGRKGILWFLGIVGGLALMGLFWVSLCLWPSESIRQTSVTASRGDPDRQDYSRSVAITDQRSLFSGISDLPVTNDWKPAEELGFDADIYTSMVSAAKALAVKANDYITKKSSEGVHITKVSLVGKGLDPQVISAVNEVFRQQNMSLQVSWYEDHPATEPTPALALMTEQYITIELDVTNHTYEYPAAGTGASWNKNNGAVRMHIKASSGDLIQTARFVEVPWLANYAEFYSRDPRRQWIVGRSTDMSDSRQSAQFTALNDAANQLIPYVQSSLRSHWNRAAEHEAVTDPQWMRQTIVDSLSAGNASYVIADRFTQCFQRPYGAQLWREAVLVHASQDNIYYLASLCVDRLGSYRAKWIRNGSSIAGMILLITVVYLFLNAATRGYYVWSLRVAGVVIVVAGVLLVLNYA